MTDRFAQQTIKHQVRCQRKNTHQLKLDSLIVEQPLQINLVTQDQQQNLSSETLTITMRTPGHDIQLAIGFLFAEGMIKSCNDIANINQDSENEVDIQLKQTVDISQFKRRFISYSSCGLCGTTLIKQLALNHQPQGINKAPWLDQNLLFQLPNLLARKQQQFAATGAVHSAALVKNNHILFCFEDVGRHNAVDKLLGHMLQQNISSKNTILLLSGRVSYELMQKAVSAQIPVVAAIGAPSALALQIAQQFDITLLGFVSEKRFNVYHGHWRLLNSSNTL